LGKTTLTRGVGLSAGKKKGKGGGRGVVAGLARWAGYPGLAQLGCLFLFFCSGSFIYFLLSFLCCLKYQNLFEM
jgi:hypothetical protein